LTFGDWLNTGQSFEKEQIIPHASSLIMSATPNPFNPTTVLSFELQAASFVKLAVYDVSGRLAAEIAGRQARSRIAGSDL